MPHPGLFKAELASLRETLKKSPKTVHDILKVAGLYATQAVISVVILKWLYAHEKWDAVLWAMISAILALQPGLSQSMVTSVIRIAANTVGASVALGVSFIPLAHELQLCTSLIIVVFACEFLRLDQALRTACVAVIIVLTTSDGHVWTSGTERFTATIIGCLMALVVQIVTDIIRKKVLTKHPVTAAVKS